MTEDATDASPWEYGYKPFGALGQSTTTSDLLAVDLDTADKDRVMMATIWSPELAFDQASPALSIDLTYNAYSFTDLDFTTPTVPTEPVVEGALALTASVSATLVIASLF